MSGDTVFYFAYGSNMDPERFRSRVGDWLSRRRARLDGYSLRFADSVQSEGGGGAVVDRRPGDHVDGVLFEAGNADAFRVAVERVCEDRSLRGRLGDRARRLIVDRGFTWDRNAETVVETFRRLGVRSERT